MKTAPLTFLTIALVLASGCATNKITGRSQAMIVSDESAAQQSTQAYTQLISESAQKRALDDDTYQLSRIQSITKPLIQQAIKVRPDVENWKWEVHLLKSEEVNAWCMAGGKMAVYTGLLQKIQPTDDELAAIMGHEISHALLSHQAEKLSRAQMQRAGLTAGVLAGAIFGVNLGNIASIADSVATVGLQLPNSRDAEAEADTVGIELAARAGFNPEASVTLWEKMIKVGGGGAPEWLSTHPNPESRIAAMKMKSQQLMPVYEAVKRGEAVPDIQTTLRPRQNTPTGQTAPINKQLTKQTAPPQAPVSNTQN